MLSDASLRRWLAPATVRLCGDLIRAGVWGAAAVTWIVFVQIYARMIRLTLADPAHSDFTIFYYTARLVADGSPMYGASPQRYGIEWAASHLGNLNPPHVQALLQPLALLDYQRAFLVWIAINGLSLAASLVIIVRALEIRLTPGRLIVWGALILAAAPFTVVAVTSELTFLLLLPATLAWAAYRRGSSAGLGVWLAVCCAVKLFFLLFLPWLAVTRRWRALGFASGAGACVLLAGVGLAGVDSYKLWVGSLGQVGWWWLPMNASWQGFVSRLLVGGRSVEPLWHAPPVATSLATIGSIAVAVATVWSAARTARPLPDLAYGTVMLGAILASPLGWVYYLPLILPPVAGVLISAQWRPVSSRWRTAAIVGLALLYVPLEQASAGQPSALATVTLASCYFYGAGAMWMASMVPAWRRA